MKYNDKGKDRERSWERGTIHTMLSSLFSRLATIQPVSFRHPYPWGPYFIHHTPLLEHFKCLTKFTDGHFVFFLNCNYLKIEIHLFLSLRALHYCQGNTQHWINVWWVNQWLRTGSETNFLSLLKVNLCQVLFKDEKKNVPFFLLILKPFCHLRFPPTLPAR